MNRLVSGLLAFVLLINPIAGQTVTPQVGGGVGQFDDQRKRRP